MVVYLAPFHSTSNRKLSRKAQPSSTLGKSWKRLFIVRKAPKKTGGTTPQVPTNKFVSNLFFRTGVNSDFLLQAPTPIVETTSAGIDHGEIKNWLQKPKNHTESHDPFEPRPTSGGPSLASTAQTPINDTQILVKTDLPLSKKRFKRSRDKSEGSKANVLDDPQPSSFEIANTLDEKSINERVEKNKEVLTNVFRDNADLIDLIDNSQSNLTKSTPNTASDFQSQMTKNALATNDSYTTFSAKGSVLKTKSFSELKSVIPSIERNLSPPPPKPPYVLPPTSAVNSGSFDIDQSFVEPSWSKQNPNTAVTDNTSKGDLIDLSVPASDTVTGSTSNQETWTKTFSQKNIMYNSSALGKPTAILQEHVRPVSKPEAQIMRSTRFQNHDTPITGKSYSVSEYEDIAIRVLEKARNTPGFASIKVELGQFLINSDTLPSLYRKKGHFRLAEWDSIFLMQGKENIEVLFADM